MQIKKYSNIKNNFPIKLLNKRKIKSIQHPTGKIKSKKK